MCTKIIYISIRSHADDPYTDFKPFGFLDMDWYITNTIYRVISRSMESGLLNYYRSYSEHVFGLMQRNSEYSNLNGDNGADSGLGFLVMMHASCIAAAGVVFLGELGWSALQKLHNRVRRAGSCWP